MSVWLLGKLKWLTDTQFKPFSFKDLNKNNLLFPSGFNKTTTISSGLKLLVIYYTQKFFIRQL